MKLFGLFAFVFITFFSFGKKVEIIEVSTNKGNMYLYLFDATPKHKANFIKLANEKYFDKTTFHRVITDFVIQGGDPNSKNEDRSLHGQGGPDYKIDAEINSSLKHDYGAIGAARDNNPDKKSSGSQFYIVVNKNGTHFLDNNYTVFGTCFFGMDVAEAISKVAKDGADNPNDRIEMTVKVIKISPKKLTKQYGFSHPDFEKKSKKTKK
jgi:cyclophilin family peptidyl-prolyl cis-trans isomerase